VGFGSRSNSNGPLRMFPSSSRSTTRIDDGPCVAGAVHTAHFVVVVGDDTIKAEAASMIKRVRNRSAELIFVAILPGPSDYGSTIVYRWLLDALVCYVVSELNICIWCHFWE
jgi:hypothetical protein